MATLKKESADKFIKLMIENTPLLKLISFAVMNDPVSSYPLATLSRFLTRPVARKEIPSLKNVGDIMINFNAKELVLPLVIPDSYIEDMQSSQEKVAKYVAEVFGMDLQYLFINGDVNATVTDSNDEVETNQVALRKALDGIVKQLTTANKTVAMDVGDTELQKIKKLIVEASKTTAIADPELRILIGSEAYTALWDSIATKSADKALLIQGDKIKYRGKEVIEIPELSKIIVMNPLHIVGGICRDITIEQQRYPEARGNKVVCSARVDFQVVTETALIEA